MFFALMHAFVRTDFLCIYVLRVASGPRVKLAGRKSALTCLALCYFVLVFFSPFNITITSLGKACLVCLFPLRVWDGLWLVIVALPGLFFYLFKGVKII